LVFRDVEKVQASGAIMMMAPRDRMSVVMMLPSFSPALAERWPLPAGVPDRPPPAAGMASVGSSGGVVMTFCADMAACLNRSKTGCGG
jgi:hypothetical protein